MIVDSEEKNSSDFCPNYVQEFGLWKSLDDPISSVTVIKIVITFVDITVFW